MAFVDIPVVVLAVVMLAAGFWALLTTTRVQAWFATADLLWLGTASFTASALLGTPLALLAVAWVFTFAGLLAALYAASGRPRLFGARAASRFAITHVSNARYNAR
jgi:hypothetical protein